MYGYNQIFNVSFILAADSYKLHHPAEAKPENTYALVVAVPRKSSKNTGKIVAAGITMVARVINDVRIGHQEIDEAVVAAAEMGYELNPEPWRWMVDENEGRLPLDIWGVEEGTVVKANTPTMAIMNSVPGFGWLAKYCETVTQRIMWKMTNTASISLYLYEEIKAAMIATGSDLSMLPYKLHNFGDRGADGQDAAIMAGISHAMVFSGSDCLTANTVIKRLYGGNKPYLSSVDATEHSVMCEFSVTDEKDDWGAAIMAVDRLYEAVERSKRGIGIPVQSVVIDTFDDERFVRDYLGTRLKDRIINSGGTLVCRPDSGDPLTRPIEIIKILHAKFGATKNDAGFWVLHPCVRVIQGDGITQDSIPIILKNLMDAGYSVDNMLFGMGGGLTHGPGRDEFSYSMKAIALYNTVLRDWTPLLKAPKTDLGKKSLSGLVRTQIGVDGELEVITVKTAYEYLQECPGWRCYFDGDVGLVYVPDFDSVKARVIATS